MTKTKQEIVKERLVDIEKYLKSPREHGIWTLKLSLNETQIQTLKTKFPKFQTSFYYGFSEHFLKFFQNLENYLAKDKIQKIKKEREILNRYLTRKNLLKEKRGRDFPSFHAYPQSLSIQESKPVLDDIKSVRKSLRKGLNYYEKNFINFIGIKSTRRRKEFLSFKDSLHFSFKIDDTFLPGSKDYSLQILSISKDVIQMFKEFFSILFNEPKVEGLFVQRLFTPETETLSLYFYNLNLIELKSRVGISNINSASVEFLDEKYEYSIRASGLAMEEIFEEIYESVLREKAPDLGLKQLYDLFMSKINKLYYGKIDGKEIGHYEKIFEQINNEVNESLKSDNKDTKNILEILRKVLQEFIKTDAEKINRLEKIVLKRQVNSIFFPQNVTENILKTFDLRNSISHRSHSEVSRTSAILALLGTLSLSFWWEEEKKSISDWDLEKIDIVKEIVERNKDI